MITFFSNPNTDLVTSKAIEAINHSLEIHKDKPILFLVSGGSALSLLDGIYEENLGPHIAISVLDERYSKDPTINNFAQLIDTKFYKKALKKNCEFIDTRVIDETLPELVNRFETSIKTWKRKNSGGYVFIIQGIGPDGHTSGIMPYPEDPNLFHELFQQKAWVTGYDAEGKNQFSLRVTTTITFLKNIVDESIVYAVGENKKKSLRKIFEQGIISEIPARVIKEMKLVSLFTNIVLK